MVKVAAQNKVCRRTTANGALRTSPFTNADISTSLSQVYEASDLKEAVSITLKGEDFDGFYRIMGFTTNYRRNYFRASCSITMSKQNSSDRVSDDLVLFYGEKYCKINAFLGFLRSSDAGETLKQYTAKRDRGPISPLSMQFSSPAQIVQSNCNLLYQRIQFKSSGRSGNTNHKYALSRSSLVFELYAQLESGQEVVISTYESSPFVIRGRSEKYFRSLEESLELSQHLETATRALMLEEYQLAPKKRSALSSCLKTAFEAEKAAEIASTRVDYAPFQSLLSWKNPDRLSQSTKQTCLPSPEGTFGYNSPTELLNFNYGSNSNLPLQNFHLQPPEFGTSFNQYATCFEPPAQSAQDLLDSFFECEDILDSQHQQVLKNRNDIGFNDPTPVKTLINETPLQVNTGYPPRSFSAPLLGQHRSETITSPVYLYSPPLSAPGTADSIESLYQPYYMAQPDTLVYDQLPWQVEMDLAKTMSRSNVFP